MTSQAGTKMLERLASKPYEKRLARALTFERVSGGGVAKQIERLTTAPGIYLPYVLNAKLGFARFHLTPVVLFWGRKVRIPLRDYDALILSMYGGLRGSELKFTKFLIKNMGKDDVFYDVGANYGFYTYLTADLCREVHTFEPMPWLASVLKRNVRAEDQMVVNPIALSGQNGTVDFYTTASTMVSTINSTVAKTFSSGVSQKITVPTMTLDSYVAAHARPTFMKIDAEGAEEQIIEGGRGFFSAHAPVIAMEVWGKENQWELSMRAVDALRAMGYRSFRLGDDGDLTEVTGDLSSTVEPDGGENFIFKK